MHEFIISQFYFVYVSYDDFQSNVSVCVCVCACTNRVCFFSNRLSFYFSRLMSLRFRNKTTNSVRSEEKVLVESLLSKHNNIGGKSSRCDFFLFCCRDEKVFCYLVTAASIITYFCMCL